MSIEITKQESENLQIKNLNGSENELFPAQLQNLLTQMHEKFESTRQQLLAERKKIQAQYDHGAVPQYLSQHPAHSEWKVKAIPADLLDRRVEITGPISSPKMVIQMLSANQDGEVANTAMLDFEDSMKPSWENVKNGYKNIIGVANKNLSFVQDDGKVYQLNANKMAHPMVRVRGLHLVEKNILVSNQPIAGGFLDLAVTAFHTAKVFLADKKTPKFYVPKCEHYMEARLWNSVFAFIEEKLGLENGTLRATFLIETLPAAFQMEEILYEIRERACGLNGGRWDKIFSDIKTLKTHKDRIVADRSFIDMTKPWMENYAKRLIKICHKHGAFAMGGMSAFTPGKEAEVRVQQTEKVRLDKHRESSIGHDGCWVSHPYFISIARKEFANKNQLNVLLPDFPEKPDLLPQAIGPKTLNGLRTNLRVGIAYQQGWDQDLGCIAFENLMEDLATLEISRAQVWQWLHHQVKLDDGTQVNQALIEKICDEECEHIFKILDIQDEKTKASYLAAKQKVKTVFCQKDLPDFFTTMEGFTLEK